MTPVKKKRKIHIDLSEEVHQKLRVKTAIEDISIQKFVETLITKAVEGVEVEKLKEGK